MKSQSNPDLTSILTSLPFEAPKGYYYRVHEFKRNYVSIWLYNTQKFLYNNGEVSKTIHSFYNYKTGKWYAPLTPNRVGDEVQIENIRPYTAMPLNQNPLAALLYS